MAPTVSTSPRLTDGDSGINAALDTDVDLILLDLRLPRSSGLDVLERVREAKPSLPVIVLTAKGEVEDRVSVLDAGAVDYIVKPFSLSELAARIRVQLRMASIASRTTLAAGGLEVDLITR